MKSLLFLVGGLALMGAAAKQSGLPGAFASHLEKLSSAQSLKVTYTGRVVGEAPVEYTLSMSKPDRFKLSSSDGFVMSDGKNLYTYTKKDNVYSEVPLDEKAIADFAKKPEVAGWGAFLLKKPLDLVASVRLGSQRTIQGNKVVEVNLTQKNNGPDTQLYVDSVLGVARGYNLKLEDKEYLAMASNIEIGKEALPDTLFAFQAPEGAKKADVAKPGSMFAKVVAIVNGNCMPCHGAANHKGGFDFTKYDGIRAAVTPGDSANSRMIMSLRAAGPGRMPQGRAPLTQDQINTIAAWIDAGAMKE